MILWISTTSGGRLGGILALSSSAVCAFASEATSSIKLRATVIEITVPRSLRTGINRKSFSALLYISGSKRNFIRSVCFCLLSFAPLRLCGKLFSSSWIRDQFPAKAQRRKEGLTKYFCSLANNTNHLTANYFRKHSGV